MYLNTGITTFIKAKLNNEHRLSEPHILKNRILTCLKGLLKFLNTPKYYRNHLAMQCLKSVGQFYTTMNKSIIRAIRFRRADIRGPP